jgi:putative nucleotidyltransferase with HDIG domain
MEMLGVFPHLIPEVSRLKGVKQPAPHVADVWEHTLSVIQHLAGILGSLDPDDPAGTNGDLFTGLLNLRLGRYRDRFAEHFSTPLNADRSVRALLFYAALYHDISKPGTESRDESGRIRFFGHDSLGAEVAAQRARSFNLSNDEIARLQIVIANHMRFHYHVNRLEDESKEPSRKSIYRFFRDAGPAGVDLVLLGLADLRGTHGHLLTEQKWTSALQVARIFLENYWERPQRSVSPPRLLDGHELMSELGMKPGPSVGRLLEAIREAQATGHIADREAALRFGRDWLSKNQTDA